MKKSELWNRVYSILLFVKEKQEDNTYLPIIAKKNGIINQKLIFKNGGQRRNQVEGIKMEVRLL